MNKEEPVCKCNPEEIQQYLNIKQQLLLKMNELAGLHMQTRQLEDIILRLNSTASSYWLELCAKYKINPNLQYRFSEDGIYEVKDGVDS